MNKVRKVIAIVFIIFVLVCLFIGFSNRASTKGRLVKNDAKLEHTIYEHEDTTYSEANSTHSNPESSRESISESHPTSNNLVEHDLNLSTYYDIPLSNELQDYIFKICKNYGVNHLIIIGMIERESMYDSNLIGDNGEAFGLMQVQPQWHQDRIDRLGVTDLLDPYQNVLVGVDYFAEMMDRGNGVTWALMAYNGGPTYANNKSESGEVSDYVTSVLYNAEHIEPVY